ncbi:MAG: glycoside hydrolase family 9 protein [Pseudomonadota bacterium]
MKRTKVDVSFTDANTVQLRFELGKVRDATPTSILPDKAPNSKGWVKVGDDWIGRVSTAPNGDQVFMPEDKYLESSIDGLFRESGSEGSRGAAVDQATDWVVRVNGEAVDVLNVSRKGSILDTANVGWREFEFTTLENVFLDLDRKLTRKDVVTIDFKDPEFEQQTQTYRPAKVVSEAIHVNLTGFDPDDGHKVAYLSSWNGWDLAKGRGVEQSYKAGTKFRVINEDTGKVVDRGRIELAKSGDEPTKGKVNFEGTDVWQMDFSDLSREGTYYVAVKGVGRSESFEISDDHWGDLFDVSFSGFYHQRSGIALEEEYTDWTRPRSLHPDDGLKVLETTIKISDTTEGFGPGKPSPFKVLPGATTGKVLKDAWGGWHDAGDWDRRPQALEASRKLIELVELQPEFAESRDGSIPESGDKIPDLLDESLWNLEFFRRLQTEDGGVRGGIESGGSPQYGDASWSESLTVYAYAPDVWASWEYAATAAKMAGVLRAYDRSAAEEWEESALAAMNWAERNIEGKLDQTEINSRNLAAVELYNLTGKEKWHDIFLETTSYDNPNTQVKWFEHQYESTFAYVRTDRETDRDVRKFAIQEFRDEAKYLLTKGDTSAFGYTVDPRAPYGWSNTGQQPNYSADFFLRMHALNGKDKWLTQAMEDVQYSLGANPNNMAYMTGLGVREPGEVLVEDADTLGRDAPPGITIFGDYNVADRGKAYYHNIMQDDVWPYDYFDVPVSESYNGFSKFIPSVEYTVQRGITDMTFLTGYLTAESMGTDTGEAFDFL